MSRPPRNFMEEGTWNMADPIPDPVSVIRETLEWIARPHGLTAKRCPKEERLEEAEDLATVALASLSELERRMEGMRGIIANERLERLEAQVQRVRELEQSCRDLAERQQAENEFSGGYRIIFADELAAALYEPSPEVNP